MQDIIIDAQKPKIFRKFNNKLKTPERRSAMASLYVFGHLNVIITPMDF
jgi:hypothetical protein